MMSTVDNSLSESGTLKQRDINRQSAIMSTRYSQLVIVCTNLHLDSLNNINKCTLFFLLDAIISKFIAAILPTTTSVIKHVSVLSIMKNMCPCATIRLILYMNSKRKLLDDQFAAAQERIATHHVGVRHAAGSFSFDCSERLDDKLAADQKKIASRQSGVRHAAGNFSSGSSNASSFKLVGCIDAGQNQTTSHQLGVRHAAGSSGSDFSMNTTCVFSDISTSGDPARHALSGHLLGAQHMAGSVVYSDGEPITPIALDISCNKTPTTYH